MLLSRSKVWRRNTSRSPVIGSDTCQVGCSDWTEVNQVQVIPVEVSIARGLGAVHAACSRPDIHEACVVFRPARKSNEVPDREGARYRYLEPDRNHRTTPGASPSLTAKANIPVRNSRSTMR